MSAATGKSLQRLLKREGALGESAGRRRSISQRLRPIGGRRSKIEGDLGEIEEAL
jgi:hypothetical protein